MRGVIIVVNNLHYRKIVVIFNFEGFKLGGFKEVKNLQVWLGYLIFRTFWLISQDLIYNFQIYLYVIIVKSNKSFCPPKPLKTEQTFSKGFIRVEILWLKLSKIEKDSLFPHDI